MSPLTVVDDLPPPRLMSRRGACRRDGRRSSSFTVTGVIGRPGQRHRARGSRTREAAQRQRHGGVRRLVAVPAAERRDHRADRTGDAVAGVEVDPAATAVQHTDWGRPADVIPDRTLRRSHERRLDVGPATSFAVAEERQAPERSPCSCPGSTGTRGRPSPAHPRRTPTSRCSRPERRRPAWPGR